MSTGRVAVHESIKSFAIEALLAIDGESDIDHRRSRTNPPAAEAELRGGIERRSGKDDNIDDVLSCSTAQITSRSADVPLNVVFTEYLAGESISATPRCENVDVEPGRGSPSSTLRLTTSEISSQSYNQSDQRHGNPHHGWHSDNRVNSFESSIISALTYPQGSTPYSYLTVPTSTASHSTSNDLQQSTATNYCHPHRYDDNGSAFRLTSLGGGGLYSAGSHPTFDMRRHHRPSAESVLQEVQRYEVARAIERIRNGFGQVSTSPPFDKDPPVRSGFQFTSTQNGKNNVTFSRPNEKVGVAISL